MYQLEQRLYQVKQLGKTKSPYTFVVHLCCTPFSYNMYNKDVQQRCMMTTLYTGVGSTHGYKTLHGTIISKF